MGVQLILNIQIDLKMRSKKFVYCCVPNDEYEALLKESAELTFLMANE